MRKHRYANEYFFLVPGQPPVQIFLETYNHFVGGISEYLTTSFNILEQDYGFSGHTVYFVWNPHTPIPKTGPNVIVVVYGEICCVPKYTSLVKLVIKSHGIFPNYAFRFRPVKLLMIEAAEYFRNILIWFRGDWRWLFQKVLRDKILDVPLGYGRSTSIESKPTSERTFITSFAGSISHTKRPFLSKFLGRPKSFCRDRLFTVLQTLTEKYGSALIRLKLTDGFYQSLQDRSEDYFEVLANSKFCVAPRGTAHETMRIYEGLKMGCVVITDRLPNRSFYRHSPIIQIDDWMDLPDMLEKLLADPANLLELQKNTLAYWSDKMSEHAFAAMCAKALNLLKN